MKQKAFLLLIGAAFLAAGCTMIPKYNRPEAPVPAKWPSGAAYKQIPRGAKAVAELPWRRFFTDERLQTVVASALQNNRDLRVAALHVERARALYRIQRAELLPTIDASGSGSRERKPAVLSDGGSPKTSDLYRADLGISYWEIDFFGRIRSLEKSALEQYLATEQARRSAQILLISEVANAYLTLAADRENLQLARKRRGKNEEQAARQQEHRGRLRRQQVVPEVAEHRDQRDRDRHSHERQRGAGAKAQRPDRFELIDQAGNQNVGVIVHDGQSLSIMAASFLRPRWMFTLTSDSLCPLAREASAIE